jgi:hypothetical protein
MNVIYAIEQTAAVDAQPHVRENFSLLKLTHTIVKPGGLTGRKFVSRKSPRLVPLFPRTSLGQLSIIKENVEKTLSLADN